MKLIIAVVAPRDSSAGWEVKMPAVVDPVTDQLVRHVLVRLFGRPLPNPN